MVILVAVLHILAAAVAAVVVVMAVKEELPLMVMVGRMAVEAAHFKVVEVLVAV